jgi:heavy metal translocating P-type ATPase
MNKIKLEEIVPFVAILGILGYLVCFLTGNKSAANYVALGFLFIGTIPLLIEMIREMFAGHFGVDLIAMVAIIASLFLRQYLAGLVILLMLSGGDALEDYALRRARKELTSLLSNAPTTAHIKENGKITDLPVEEIAIGSIIVVKPGEIIPADGMVMQGTSRIDESALTGESMPLEVFAGSQVLSGAVNKDGLLEIKALKESKDSKYEQLIRLIKNAEKNKAPIVRLADRYTVIFTIITFALSLLAWIISHQPVRILAVLVVATPCPLILATPIAIISGVSKSAKRGIIVKGGGALEQLGEAKAFIFDKTGTITLGTPRVSEVRVYNHKQDNGASAEAAQSPVAAEKIVQIAASLDQLSTHILARSLGEYAKSKKIQLQYPEEYIENFGDGVSGKLNLGESLANAADDKKLYYDKKPQKYLFGKLAFIEKQKINIIPEIKKEHQEMQQQGNISVYLADEKNIIGAIFFADVIRPESKKVFEELSQSGVGKIIMLTGDRKEVAEHISKQLNLQDVIADSLPENKVAIVKELQAQKIKPVVMIGDGINDAPALATAEVGIAMGAHGNSASSEASDIVITVDNLNRVAEGYAIAKYALKVALQGIFIGMGLSIALMIIASFGYITPVLGAILQEIIDVLVIFNALRVQLQQ